jgi:hypothetical protein
VLLEVNTGFSACTTRAVLTVTNSFIHQAELHRPIITRRVCSRKKTCCRTVLSHVVAAAPRHRHGSGPANREVALLLGLAGVNRYAAQQLWLRKERIKAEASQFASAGAPQASQHSLLAAEPSRPWTTGTPRGFLHRKLFLTDSEICECLSLYLCLGKQSTLLLNGLRYTLSDAPVCLDSVESGQTKCYC